MAEETEYKVTQEDEIDLIELGRTIWAGRKFIAKVTGVFAIIGLVIAFTSPVEYEASCKLLPESQENQMPNLGGLAGLAGLAGVDLGSASGASSGILTPQLYPEIVNSLPFIMEVMNDTIYFEQADVNTTSYLYFKKNVNPSIFSFILKYTIGLPSLIKNTLNNKNEVKPQPSSFVRLSKVDWKLIQNFKKRINLEIDPDTGIIEVFVEMPDAHAAAQIAKKIELMITKSVIDYKTNKALKNLEFIQKTYDESKIEFENVQLKLARVVDRNKNVNSEIAQIELRKIEHEYDIAFDVYKGLSSQIEQAKIQLKEETPVFTILEPVRIPEDKSKPKRTVILILCFSISLPVGIILLFGTRFFNNLRNHTNL